MEQELSLLRREVRALTQKVEKTELKMERLEGQLTLLTVDKDGGVTPAPQTPVATTRKATPQKEPKIARLSGKRRELPVVKLSNTAQNGGYAAGALDDGSPPIVIKLEGASDDKLPVDHDVLKRVDPALPGAKRPASKAEIKAAYEIARAKLRVDKKPAKARKLFLRFQARFPKSRYADNVAYWLGECDFAQGKLRSAHERFVAMSKTFERSPKVPFALLRAAEAQTGLENHAASDALLRRIIKEHPGTEAAKTAEARLAASEGRR